MRLGSSALLLLCVMHLAFPGVAYADDDERARQLFDQGHDAADRGDHATACQRFEESLALVRRASTLLNLGACYDKLGRLTTALRYWQEGAGALPPEDERVARAHERIASLEDRIPRLRLVVPAELPPGATVALDGTTLTDLDAELRVDPARHEVSLVAPGHAPTRVVVTVSERARDTVTLTLGPVLAPPVPLPPPAPPPRPAPSVADSAGHTIPIWVWPVGAIGVGLGIAAVPFAVDYSNTVERQHDRCGDDLEQCRPEPPGSYDPSDDNARKERDAIAGSVLGAAGAAMLVAAIIGAAMGEEPERRARVRLRVLAIEAWF
jgi:hypothetical protein